MAEDAGIPGTSPEAKSAPDDTNRAMLQGEYDRIVAEHAGATVDIEAKIEALDAEIEAKTDERDRLSEERDERQAEDKERLKADLIAAGIMTERGKYTRDDLVTV